jgi:N-acetylneuraminate synthase|tara:strand:- start:4600 stop:6507 length:1908 start_codon:yes stop_codon:yes gene_type:complete
MKLERHIDNIKLSSDYRYTYIIAEIGINHNGNLSEALKLIQAAHDTGVDAVKFQKRKLENLYTQKILDDPNSAEWTFEYLIPILQEVELSDQDYRDIKNECDKLNLELIITPFDLESAQFCNDLGVTAFKIGSADMINYELIEKCFSFDKPMIISTGMWSEKEIQSAISEFRTFGKNDFFMLLANSTYPTPYEAINLEFLPKLNSMHNLIGYSGHERGTFIPVAAATLGARIVEKHITFDRTQTGPDHKASMLPEEFNEMVTHLRSLQLALGKNKVVNQAEKLAKETFAKSAYAKVDLLPGHILTEDDIYFTSPGKGIHLHQVQSFYGKELKCKVDKDSFLTSHHFEEIILVKDWKLPQFSKRWGIKCRFHDFEEYKTINSPVVEFHCSQRDMDIDFKGFSNESQLVVHAPEIFDRKLVDICSDDPEIVEGSIYLLQQAIDKTLAISKNFPLKKPKFVVHLGGMSLDQVIKENNTELMMERSVDNFKKLRFNSDDIDILPENLPPRPWYLGGQWFQYGFMFASDMIDFCNHFNFKMTYDICHAALHCHHSNTSLEEYTRRVLPLVSHFHLSDATGIDGEGVQIGEGEVNFDSFFKEIENFNEDFSWVTEIWSGHVNHGAGCRNSMHNLSKYKNII